MEPQELRLSREIKQLKLRWLLQWVSQFFHHIYFYQKLWGWLMSSLILHGKCPGLLAIEQQYFAKIMLKGQQLLYICFNGYNDKGAWGTVKKLGGKKVDWVTKLGNCCPKLSFHKAELRSFYLIDLLLAMFSEGRGWSLQQPRATWVLRLGSPWRLDFVQVFCWLQPQGQACYFLPTTAFQIVSRNRNSDTSVSTHTGMWCGS